MEHAAYIRVPVQQAHPMSDAEREALDEARCRVVTLERLHRYASRAPQSSTAGITLITREGFAIDRT